MVGCQIDLEFSDNTVLPLSPITGVRGVGGPRGYARACARDSVLGKLALLVSLIPPEFVDHTYGEMLVTLDATE